MFALHHCSAIRLIRLDMCLVFLFASVIIVFVYDSDRYGTAATSGKELFMINLMINLMIPVVAFCNRGICFVCFSSPISTFFIFFLIVNISPN